MAGTPGIILLQLCARTAGPFSTALSPSRGCRSISVSSSMKSSWLSIAADSDDIYAPSIEGTEQLESTAPSVLTFHLHRSRDERSGGKLSSTWLQRGGRPDSKRPAADGSLSIVLHNATAIPLSPTYHTGLEEAPGEKF